jgi:hypothetical protein
MGAFHHGSGQHLSPADQAQHYSSRKRNPVIRILTLVPTRRQIILHSQSRRAQDASTKGAGISNIEYRLHEFRSDGSLFLKQKKKERSDTTLQYSTFLVRHSLFSFLFSQVNNSFSLMLTNHIVVFNI